MIFFKFYYYNIVFINYLNYIIIFKNIIKCILSYNFYNSFSFDFCSFIYFYLSLFILYIYFVYLYFSIHIIYHYFIYINIKCLTFILQLWGYVCFYTCQYRLHVAIL